MHDKRNLYVVTIERATSSARTTEVSFMRISMMMGNIPGKPTNSDSLHA